MAGLHRSEYGVYKLTFYFDRHKICRSTATKNLLEAQQIQKRVERTLSLIENGHLELPQPLTKDKLWNYLRTGGNQSDPSRLIENNTLSEVCLRYLNSYTDGTKEKNTLQTEKYHTNHFQRIIGRDVEIGEISAETVTEYIRLRQQEKGTHGGHIKGETIKKELQTLSSIWTYAETRGWVRGENPLKYVKRPRGSEKPPFKTLEEVEMRLERGDLTESEKGELCESIFLRELEISEFLKHVSKVVADCPRFRFIYPAIAFCAYTGARRSEMIRCEVDDVKSFINIREKKKSQKHVFTYRQIPLHIELRCILDTWILEHPGGRFLFCKNGGQQLDGKTAREAFTRIKKDSRWSILRGYHVLRHSFASNLARNGVDQRQIDEFMGHQTDESRKRYRHLSSEDRETAINALSFSSEGIIKPGKFRIVG